MPIQVPLSVYRKQIARERKAARVLSLATDLVTTRTATESNEDLTEKRWHARRLEYLLATGQRAKAYAEGLIPASARNGDSSQFKRRS